MTKGNAVMKRLILVATLLALAVPGAGQAAPTSYSTPFQVGPRGGDQYNQYSSDAATGDMTVLRVNPAGISGGLGCGGTGGYDNFKVIHPDTGPVTSVSVAYTNAIVDPYSWINIGVRQAGSSTIDGDSFIESAEERGILAGDGVVKLNLPAGSTGPLEIWFGIQVISACPNVDGGHATFTSVTVE
jgi:hypothetical protein